MITVFFCDNGFFFPFWTIIRRNKKTVITKKKKPLSQFLAKMWVHFGQIWPKIRYIMNFTPPPMNNVIKRTLNGRIGLNRPHYMGHFLSYWPHYVHWPYFVVWCTILLWGTVWPKMTRLELKWDSCHFLSHWPHYAGRYYATLGDSVTKNDTFRIKMRFVSFFVTLTILFPTIFIYGV